LKIGIIGAGVIGLSIGHQLASRGLDTTVFDADQAGMAASGMNAGWVSPFLSTPRAAPGVVQDAIRGLKDPNGPVKFHLKPELSFARWGARFLVSSAKRRSDSITKALQALAAHAPAQLDALHEDGVEFESYADGLGVVFLNAENLNNYLAHEQQLNTLGYEGTVTAYRGADAQAFDPAITESAAGVLHIENDRHVRPESLVNGLAAALTQGDGVLRENTRIVRIVQECGSRWTVVTAGGSHHTFDHLVVAAGVASKKLLKPLGVRLPLEAAKGVSLTAKGIGVRPRHPLKLFERMVASSPYEGNLLRLSGTFDVAARSPHVNPDRLRMVVRDAQQFFDSWQPTEIEKERAGHRPTSGDDAPLIGPVKGRDGLYVATGHGTLGVTLGPMTGVLVAREISRGSAEPLLTPFRPERFGRLF
jgi:D-amino-acid dehydrogenase